MIELAQKRQCSGCSACAAICPCRAIEMQADEEGFLYPRINEDSCISCGQCLNVCPVIKAAGEKQKRRQEKGYICYALDDRIRAGSTSGGVFTELAKCVLRNNGIVYGAAFDKSYAVRHIGIREEADLLKLSGSKYVQSSLGEVYQEIRERLEEGGCVLFSGTPCQVGGLKKYLKKEYPNLLTVDFVCYGVGSPLVWKKYLESFYRTDKIRNIIFKEKKYGWRNWHFAVFYKHYVRREKGTDNLYMSGYLKGIFLRPSCYECSFKGLERASDMTIADCWGIERLNPSIYPELGVSAVAAHTERGNEVLKRMEGQMYLEPADMEQLFRDNPYAFRNALCSPGRESFFEALRKNGRGAFKEACIEHAFVYYIKKYFLVHFKHLTCTYSILKHRKQDGREK